MKKKSGLIKGFLGSKLWDLKTNNNKKKSTVLCEEQKAGVEQAKGAENPSTLRSQAALPHLSPSRLNHLWPHIYIITGELNNKSKLWLNVGSKTLVGTQIIWITGRRQIYPSVLYKRMRSWTNKPWSMAICSNESSQQGVGGEFYRYPGPPEKWTSGF